MKRFKMVRQKKVINSLNSSAIASLTQYIMKKQVNKKSVAIIYLALAFRKRSKTT